MALLKMVTIIFIKMMKQNILAFTSKKVSLKNIAASKQKGQNLATIRHPLIPITKFEAYAGQLLMAKKPYGAIEKATIPLLKSSIQRSKKGMSIFMANQMVRLT
jgi:hypothetical protein